MPLSLCLNPQPVAGSFLLSWASMSKLIPLPCNSPSSAWSQLTCPWGLLQGRISTSISATPGLPETSTCVQITPSSYSLQRRGQFLTSTSTSTFIDTCQPSGGLYWVDHNPWPWYTVPMSPGRPISIYLIFNLFRRDACIYMTDAKTRMLPNLSLLNMLLLWSALGPPTFPQSHPPNDQVRAILHFELNIHLNFLAVCLVI